MSSWTTDTCWSEERTSPRSSESDPLSLSASGTTSSAADTTRWSTPPEMTSPFILSRGFQRAMYKLEGFSLLDCQTVAFTMICRRFYSDSIQIILAVASARIGIKKKKCQVAESQSVDLHLNKLMAIMACIFFFWSSAACIEFCAAEKTPSLKDIQF